MRIDKKEVLRYLGYKNQPVADDLNSLIDSCIAQCESTARPMSVYKIFKITKITRAENGVLLDAANLTLRGANIANHLKQSPKCGVMAATLGAAVDSLIRISQVGDMTRAVILDACASELIEKYCDEVNGQIAKDAAAEGFTLKPRFSPGYGDFPLEMQPSILRLLDASKKIGLTCTEDFMMIPQKSVTAVVGFLKKDIKEDICLDYHKCSSCGMALNCEYSAVERDGSN